MHEQCFEFALGKMYNAHKKREFLERRRGRGGAVDNRAGEVNERVNEKRAEVFDDEDGTPGYLRA